MTLKELFDVVPESQYVRLCGERFDEIRTSKLTLEMTISDIVLGMDVKSVMATFGQELEVWVGEICKVT